MSMGRLGEWIFGQILFSAGLITFALTQPAHAQGVATGGTAVPARPLPAGMKAPVVEYRDIAKQAGLDGVNISGSETSKQYIVETTGNGVAIFDFDNDGLPDIFLVNSGSLDKDAVQPKHFLYHNLGGLKFEDVTDKAGIKLTGWGQGVCVGDVDNHGYPDLFITQWGQSVLYRNLGNGTFKDETKQRGLASAKPRWSTGCAFLDFNHDGFLDLVVVHYVDFDLAHTPHPGQTSQCQWKGKPVMCGPRGLPPETLSFYQNDGHGNFTDVSDQLHISGPRNYYGFTALTGDFDNDGWPDIFVACDSTASLYYHNLGGKRFEEIGVRAGLAYNEDGREQAGMGAAAADFDGDGLLDIFKTNFADDTHTMYRNQGANNFEDDTIGSGLAVNTKYLGWGTAFLDFDNDGWKDLIVANGHVYPEVDTGHTAEKYKEPRLLYWNRGDGQFFDLSSQGGSGITDVHSSRGLAVGDLDNDGSEEVLISNMGEAPSLLKNFADNGNSLLVRALTSARDAIGARITVTAGGHKQIDEVRSGGSYISQNDLRLHFGLGSASTADISVRWLDGKVENFKSAAAGQILTIEEGKGIVRTQHYSSSKK
ncbi:MAG: ASPIC/UnbV domain protein [Acidobacteriaceae bacterium]|nr:ASPIC/UnbV domain protein [Acidobacteriaceae bacterium]